MIPRKIEIRNFLSYGSTLQTIDFKEYPLICFSGRNGHGKSALLDAITWSIWGQARKVSGTSKADEGLLRLGETQMVVSIEFDSCGSRFRVRREFAKTHGKNHAALDFELYNNEGQRFISLTDKTIRATQQKIEKTIGLDFETFVNSAFLRQGNSNEFSQKTPRERKTILTTILGLSRFDQLQKRSQEYARKYGSEKIALLAIHEKNEIEIARRSVVEAALRGKQADLAGIDDEQKKVQEIFAQIEAKQVQFDLLSKQRAELVLEIEAAGRKRRSQVSAFTDALLAWKRVHHATITGVSIEELLSQRDEYRVFEKELRSAQQKILECSESIVVCNEALQKRTEELKKLFEIEIEQSKQALEKDRLRHKKVTFVLEHNTQEYEKKTRAIAALEKAQEEHLTALSAQQSFLQQFEQSQEHFAKRKTVYQLLAARGNKYQEKVAELTTKKKVASDQNNPACPLCEQVLTAKRKQFLYKRFERQDVFWAYKVQRVAKLMGRLKEKLVEQHSTIEGDKKNAEDLYRRKLQMDENKKLLKQFQEEQKEFAAIIAAGLEQHKQLEKTCATNQYSLEKKQQGVRDRIKEDTVIVRLNSQRVFLEKTRDAIVYDKEKHVKTTASLEALEKQIVSQEALHKEQAQQDERRRRCKVLTSDIRELDRHIQKLEKKRRDSVLDDASFKQHQMQRAEVKKHVSVVQQRRETCLKEVLGLQNDLKRIEILARDAKKTKETISSIQRNIDDYHELSTIWGKDGLQALLIEESIPEIEQEANAILARLTDNNAHIIIESLRDLKKGGARETLDIKISDSAGMRPYEMFSGGEAFRIDFALRIALSKLLARRAGTTLETLVIDEGFGSQDEEGLHRLMDALLAIRSDFSRIIVVSHLAAFKENFPVHFVIEKGTTGSRVTVSERV